MAPKNPRSTRGKPGAGAAERRQPLSSGAASNNGQKLTSKLQAAYLKKRPDPLEDSNSRSRLRGNSQDGDGPVIPDIFKAPLQEKRLMATTGMGATSSTTSSLRNRLQEHLEISFTAVQLEFSANPSQVSDNIIEGLCSGCTSDVTFRSNLGSTSTGQRV
ncbi:hypothetical protein NDU88_007451 [Pleurodeles waltl]|uniref:Uncharacterized protein n=1 Tax=Pleurodeles waltl TaxID=8319 RepID=A0AAV7MGH7_PLEWA|nr:hypothetical protein NDU88_007451 [Pleurodeles waltl]